MKILILLSLLISSVLTNAESNNKDSYIYEIKNGDTLGSILIEKGFFPLWGENGFIKKTIQLNQKTIYNNGNLIFPNTKIVLPRTTILKSRKIASSDIMASDINFKSHGKIRFSSWLGFSKIIGTDTKTKAQGEIFSKLNRGILVEWEQLWSKTISTSLFVDYQEQVYEENPDRTLENEKVSMTNLGFKLDYFFNTSFFISNKLRYGESLYLYAANSTSLRFDTASTLKVSSSLNYKFIELDPFFMTATLGATSIYAANIEDYKSKNGFGYFGQISINQKYKNKILKGAVSYSNMNQDTTAFEQSHEHLKFSFSIAWELF